MALEKSMEATEQDSTQKEDKDISEDQFATVSVIKTYWSQQTLPLHISKWKMKEIENLQD